MSNHAYSVRLGEIIQEFNLEVLCAAPDYENVPLYTVDVNRPGLPLSGFFEHFDTERLLLIGLTETTYVAGMTSQQRRESFDRLLAYPVPALIITRGLEPFPECLEMARQHDIEQCQVRERFVAAGEGLGAGRGVDHAVAPVGEPPDVEFREVDVIFDVEQRMSAIGHRRVYRGFGG